MGKTSLIQHACNLLVKPERWNFNLYALGEEIQMINCRTFYREPFQVLNTEGYKMKGDIFSNQSRKQLKKDQQKP